MNNKLHTALLSCSSPELLRFEKFLDSPYFNEQETLNRFFSFLYKDLKKKKNTLASPEYYWKLVFPKSAFNDQKFRRLCSDLHRLLLLFFKIEAFKNDPFEFSKTEMQVASNRDLEKHYRTAFRHHEKLISEQKLETRSGFWHSYHQEWNRQKFQEHIESRTTNLDLDAVVQTLDTYYLAERLNLYCEQKNYERVLRIPSTKEGELIHSILDWVKSGNLDNQPKLIQCYFTIVQMLESHDELHYQNLKLLLDENANRFEQSEAWKLYGFAQNYCIGKINSGKQEYLDELFGLYNVLLERGIILTDDTLSPWHYKNIIAVGLRLQKFDWTESFINNYKEKLPDAYRENAYTYNLAKLYFARKDYKLAIELLQQVEYQDVFYNLDSKSLLLKTYYELEEWEALDSFLHSFQLFIHRQKTISSDHRSAYMNLIRFTGKLMRLRSGKGTLLKIEEQIAKASKIADKNWMAQKIEELKVKLV